MAIVFESKNALNVEGRITGPFEMIILGKSDELPTVFIKSDIYFV